MRFYQIKEGSVEDLEKYHKDTEATSYDAIDRLMKTIAKEYDITPKKLHDLFVEKHGVIPDDWIKDKLDEAWSEKYKRSINCKNPKGFSQRAHCQGRKKKRQNTNEQLAESLSSWVAQDQNERNEYKKFVDSNAGGNYEKGAQMYAALKNRSSDDIFGDRARLSLFMNTKFNFENFSEEDWDNYWLLAQHCDMNRTFQQQALANIEKYLGKNNSHYHYLSDRLSCAISGTQKYNTQSGCEKDSTFKNVKENFADGRNPEHKGDSKRYGVPTKGSISSLRKIAKQGGRKGQLAHWMANMKSGKRKKKTNESLDNKPNLIDMFEIILPIAMHEIGLTKLPKIHLVNQVDDLEQPTFGQYRNKNKVIYLGIKNRHPLDIIRTLVHELTHHKQNLEGHLGPHSGDTGSPEENEAHAKAGIIMRHINKKYPEFFDADSIELP